MDLSHYETIKALVIRQPWAWAIMEGHKRIENRTWKTPYRGPLAIIAGSSSQSLIEGTDFLRRLGIVRPANLRFGCILGIVQLVDIVRAQDVSDQFASGPWCWVLEEPEKLPRPIQFHDGQQRIFELPISALSEAQMPPPLAGEASPQI